MIESPVDGKTVRRFRLLRGLSQAELARRCGCDRKTISRIEMNRFGTVSTRLLNRIAAVLDVSPDTFCNVSRSDFELVDLSDLPRLTEYFEEIANAKTCFVCTQGLDGYLVPDELIEWHHRRRLESLGLPQDEINSTVKAWLSYVEKERSMRRKSNFRHEIIASDRFFDRAFQAEPEWVALVKERFKDWQDGTAVCFANSGGWTEINRLIRQTAKVRIWDKTMIVDDTLLMIRLTPEAFLFTRKRERILQFQAAIDQARDYLPYGLPSDGQLTCSQCQSHAVKVLEQVARRHEPASWQNSKKGPQTSVRPIN